MELIVLLLFILFSSWISRIRKDYLSRVVSNLLLLITSLNVAIDGITTKYSLFLEELGKEVVLINRGSVEAFVIFVIAAFVSIARLFFTDFR